VEAVHTLVDHLFRRESGKMVASLARLFGTHNLDLAEDVVQETLLSAVQRWPFDGVPANPAGWLYQVARRRAIDAVRRQQTFRRFAPELTRQLQSAPEQVAETLFLAGEIEDDTLRMMFTCCHPQLSPQSRIALTLNILCGFGTAEIARALLANPAAVEKRLTRAKRTVRAHADANGAAASPGRRQAAARLESVIAVLYLMFNEGYNSSFAEHPIRRDVCEEAMRLARLLANHEVGRGPKTAALMALMCFHSARFDARTDGDGNILALRSQDRARWDRGAIAEGFAWLEQSAEGEEPSELHLEAGLAAQHCLAAAYDDTHWLRIVTLYDYLLAVRPSPLVALNRAVAVGELHGAAAGLEAILAIEGLDALDGYYLLPAALGEMHLRLGHLGEAERLFARAAALTASPAEQQLLRGKLAASPHADADSPRA
jgi:RNA polymerase sigma factor (sigma-70 family)